MSHDISSHEGHRNLKDLIIEMRLLDSITSYPAWLIPSLENEDLHVSHGRKLGAGQVHDFNPCGDC